MHGMKGILIEEHQMDTVRYMIQTENIFSKD